MHTRVHCMPAVSMGNYWTTKISAITWFQRIISQFTRKTPFSEKNKTYLQKLYTKRFYAFSFVLYARFPWMFSLFTRNGGFMTFEFLWPTTISPRNAPLGSRRQCKMVKAYSLLFFITDNGEAAVWFLVCWKVIPKENNFLQPFGWVQKLLISFN